MLVTVLGTVSKIPGRDDLKADMFSSDSWVRLWRRRCGKVILVARHVTEEVLPGWLGQASENRTIAGCGRTFKGVLPVA